MNSQPYREKTNLCAFAGRVNIRLGAGLGMHGTGY